MRKTFAELSKAELKNNPNSFVLLGDISVGNFLDSDDNLPDRVLNMGIVEQAMIGFGAGLSTGGGNIIVHTIAAFLIERAFEQIKLCCGYNKNKLILVSANGPYDYEKLGPTHHSPGDVSLLMTIPNMNIRVPATIVDMKECYNEALGSDDSTYIRCTSRAVDIQEESFIIDNRWKKIANRSSSRAIVCIGESLAYALSKYSHEEIYWTVDPKEILPSELEKFEEILILESYTGHYLVVPSELSHKKIIKRCFKPEYKKIIRKNLGWEDFAE